MTPDIIKGIEIAAKAMRDLAPGNPVLAAASADILEMKHTLAAKASGAKPELVK